MHDSTEVVDESCFVLSRVASIPEVLVKIQCLDVILVSSEGTIVRVDHKLPGNPLLQSIHLLVSSTRQRPTS